MLFPALDRDGTFAYLEFNAGKPTVKEGKNCPQGIGSAADYRCAYFVCCVWFTCTIRLGRALPDRYGPVAWLLRIQAKIWSAVPNLRMDYRGAGVRTGQGLAGVLHSASRCFSVFFYGGRCVFMFSRSSLRNIFQFL